MPVMGYTSEDATGYRRRSIGRLSYLLGGWGKRKDANSGKLLDVERDNWKPILTVVKATVQYLQEIGRLAYQPEERQVG
jgi:hypothetical protein